MRLSKYQDIEMIWDHADREGYTSSWLRKKGDRKTPKTKNPLANSDLPDLWSKSISLSPMLCETSTLRLKLSIQDIVSHVIEDPRAGGLGRPPVMT